MNDTLLLAGRLLMAAIFVLGGYGKLTHHDATVAYIAGAGMPLPPVSYYAAVFVELIVGLAFALGLFTRVSAAVLAVFCVVTAVMFHGDFSGPGNQIQFMKNLMMAGLLLYPAALGGGAFAVDAMVGTRRATGATA